MGCCAGKGKPAEEAETEIKRKIIVVGDSGVGKTCLIRSYINGEFDEFTPQSLIPSILETHVKEFPIKDKKVIAVICDTGGQETFKHLRKTSYPNSDAMVVCFSLDNADSLKSIHDMWVPEMQKVCPGIPMILVGNKKDLRDETPSLAGFIQESKGNQAAKKHKMLTYIECSALTGENIDKVFQTIIIEAAKRKKVNVKKKNSFDSV